MSFLKCFNSSCKIPGPEVAAFSWCLLQTSVLWLPLALPPFPTPLGSYEDIARVLYARVTRLLFPTLYLSSHNNLTRNYIFTPSGDEIAFECVIN